MFESSSLAIEETVRRPAVYDGGLTMAREFSAGGVLVRWRKGRWWMAAIEPQGRTASGTGKETLALPKGLIDPGEKPEQTALREIHEETGIMAYVERLAGIYCWPEQNELIFSFLCTVIGGTLQISDETHEVRFFAPDALPANLLQEHQQRTQYPERHYAPGIPVDLTPPGKVAVREDLAGRCS